MRFRSVPASMFLVMIFRTRLLSLTCAEAVRQKTTAKATATALGLVIFRDIMIDSPLLPVDFVPSAGRNRHSNPRTYHRAQARGKTNGNPVKATKKVARP